MTISCNDYKVTRRRMLAATGASMFGMTVPQMLAAQGKHEYNALATADHSGVGSAFQQFSGPSA